MTIVITGANRGIGRALRDHFRDLGQTVYGTTRGQIPEDDPHWITLDVARPDGFAHLAERLDSVPIDLLICNAGVYLDKGMSPATDYPAQVWAETFAVNVTGVFLTVQSLLPNLQMSEAPKVAVMSSLMGSSARAPGGSYVYRASKAAATNLAMNLATDLRDLGIAVGAYHPGWVQTEMGGPEAEQTIENSVAGLTARFAALDLETTGASLGYDGSDLRF